MLSAHLCLGLYVARCFEQRMWASSGNCQEKNIRTAGESMILIPIFTKMEGIR